MPASRRACIGIVLLLCPSLMLAQPEWLPSELMEAMVESLAGNLRFVDPDGELVVGDGQSMARSGIQGTLGRIETLGRDGLVKLAPDFSQVEVPSSGDPVIDAMVSWGVCSIPAQAAFADSSSAGGGVERRVTAAAMVTTVALVNTFLRHEYLQSGTTDEQVRDSYARPEIGEIFGRIRSDGSILVQTMNECLEPLDELMQ